MFRCTIKTTNAAFDGHCNTTFEIARILRDLADRVEQNGADIYLLHDSNGNTVGTGKLTK